MIVALGATDGEPHPDRAGGVHPIDRIANQEFLGDGAPFRGRDIAAIESSIIVYNISVFFK